jgi:hypothetical protein
MEDSETVENDIRVDKITIDHAVEYCIVSALSPHRSVLFLSPSALST